MVEISRRRVHASDIVCSASSFTGPVLARVDDLDVLATLVSDTWWRLTLFTDAKDVVQLFGAADIMAGPLVSVVLPGYC